MNILKPAKHQKLIQIFQAGFSIRESGRIANVVFNTALKYFHRFNAGQQSPILCPCGKLSTHKGWCFHRIIRSEKRRAFMSRWHPGLDFSVDALSRRRSLRQQRIITEPPLTHYPYLSNTEETPGNKLSLIVNSLVSKNIPEQFRADLCQEIILLILSGDLKVEQIGISISTIKRRLYRRYHDPRVRFSLDLNGDIAWKDEA